MRKYVGVPTKEEVETQLNELVERVKDITTIEALRKFKEENKNVLVEANYDCLDYFNDKYDELDVVRYEYKNILVYFNIFDGKAVLDENITVCSDDDIQFDAVKLEDYDAEVERVSKFLKLELVK